MQNELIEQWTKLNKSAMDAIKELGEINTSAMTRLTQRQMDLVNLYMEGGAKQLEAFNDAKGVQDVVGTQSRLFTELNEKLMDNARQTVDELVNVQTELSTWAEKGMEQATTNLSPSS
ncbi:phasin family protein [Candidatus Marithioploca araucensis]|uniref:Phasin family protein n=1 Tax=Candidatus Marithioploca araucensis TaxID=70273 RepID=A0ABT7VRT3_9GAMM|nr:phasin family protein [Candidatus Marithioploca araucensis]